MSDKFLLSDKFFSSDQSVEGGQWNRKKSQDSKSLQAAKEALLQKRVDEGVEAMPEYCNDGANSRLKKAELFLKIQS